MLLSLFPVLSSCASEAASAEEYYAIGTAYYELGKYDEAERWYNRANSVDKTMTASEYNLGRIDFSAGRYGEAARHFETIIERDPENVMALKSAAYSRIKNGDLILAEAHYQKVLALVPESADDGFNYALVLFAMEKYEACEEQLKKYDFSLEENNDALLLLARAQAAGDKPEAADTYDKWIANNTETPDPKVFDEYGKMLEKLELYAKAVEQYRAGAAVAVSDEKAVPKKQELLFNAARVLLVSDPESEEGITELKAAREAGFNDTAALDELLLDERLTEAHKETLTAMIFDIENDIPATPESAVQTTDAAAAEAQTPAQNAAQNGEAVTPGTETSPPAGQGQSENQTQTGTNTPQEGNNTGS